MMRKTSQELGVVINVAGRGLENTWIFGGWKFLYKHFPCLEAIFEWVWDGTMHIYEWDPRTGCYDHGGGGWQHPLVNGRGEGCLRRVYVIYITHIWAIINQLHVWRKGLWLPRIAGLSLLPSWDLPMKWKWVVFGGWYGNFGSGEY